MRKKDVRKFAILSLPLVAATTVALTGCSVKNSTDTYIEIYQYEIENFNYLQSAKGLNTQHLVNFVDGLMENDIYGNFVPALAESYEVSEPDSEGRQTWTFTLKDTSWYDYKGEEYAPVTASDFVTGAQWILNSANMAEAVDLWFEFVENAKAYYCSTMPDPVKACEPDGIDPTDDFSKVGIKAVDGKVVYTLKQPTPYFDTALSYTSFFPVNAEYLRVKGSRFGTTFRDILYSGAFIMKQHSLQKEIHYQKNENYWDAGNVNFKNVKLVYLAGGGSNPDMTRLIFENGELSGYTLNEKDPRYNQMVYGKKNVSPEDLNEHGLTSEGYGRLNPKDERVQINTPPPTSSFGIFLNMERTTWTQTEIPSSKRNDTNKALQNQNARKAIFHAIDRAKVNSDRHRASGGLDWVTNTYTRPGLAGVNIVDEDTNDVERKDYVDYISDVFREKNENNSNSEYNWVFTDGGDFVPNKKDVIYNPSQAKEYALLAKEELTREGVTFPVEIEWLSFDSTPGANAALRDTIGLLNDAIGDIFHFRAEMPVQSEYQKRLNERDFNLVLSGWSPDYGDPTTYLATLKKAGYMGIAYSGYDRVDSEYLDILLEDYERLYDEANQFYREEDIELRYAKFAEAEYELIYEKNIFLPVYVNFAEQLQMTYLQPFTSTISPSGPSHYKYKYRILLSHLINRAEFNQFKEEYETNRPAND